ncbi:TPA: hypothetical protein REU56_002937, partial [Listeria monocytogenes]|nr:hypothetical protein [Listeria monocytogenes]
MKANYQHQVILRTESRPYLIPVFSHVHDIPRRVYEYDSSFFVVFNTKIQRYQIHSLDYPGEDTYSCTIPYPELDSRALNHLWYNDIRVHGNEIFKRLESADEKREKQKERERKNFDIDFAKEHQSA